MPHPLRPLRSLRFKSRFRTTFGMLGPGFRAYVLGSALIPSLLSAQATPPPAATPPAASQNPSPMVETTRAHERLTPSTLRGTTRTFAGPAGRAVEVWVPDRLKSRKTFDLVVHFHGVAWLPQQAVAAQGRDVVAVAVEMEQLRGAS